MMRICTSVCYQNTLSLVVRFELQLLYFSTIQHEQGLETFPQGIPRCHRDTNEHFNALKFQHIEKRIKQFKQANKQKELQISLCFANPFAQAKKKKILKC